MTTNVTFETLQRSLHFLAGTYAECLQIWRGQNSEPYVHFVHMFDSFGMLFTPLLGTQLLPGKDGESNWNPIPRLTPLQTFFVSMGVLTLMVVPANLYFGLKKQCHKISQDDNTKTANIPAQNSRPLKVLVLTFSALYFLRTPLKLLGIQITAFGANSDLELSSAEGAALSALYWTCITVVRITAIVLSSKIDGRKTIHVLMFMSMLSCLYVVARQSSLTLLELQICLAVAAIGSGPQFSINMVLFQGFHPVDVSISGLLLLGHILGLKFFSPVISFYMEDHPYTLFSVTAINCGCCLVIFILLELFRQPIQNSIQPAVEKN